MVEAAADLKWDQILRFIESDPARFINSIKNLLLETSPLLKITAPPVEPLLVIYSNGMLKLNREVDELNVC
jgi:hypothetical protein